MPLNTRTWAWSAGMTGTRLMERNTVDFETLLPEHYSLLVSGPPGVGKFEWFLDLTRTFLEKGERVAFVTLDLHPDEIRKRAAAQGLELEAREGAGFLFIDGFSTGASERPEPTPSGRKVYTVSSYSNLEGLGMAISKAAADLRPPVRVLFYSVSTLFLHNSAAAIAKFFQIVTNRVKTNIGFISYAMHEGVHDILTANLLRSLVDGVVEIRFTESMEREIRPHHLRGIPVAARWQPFALAGGDP